ncbi:MAG: EF-P beta-lysylation protein EpmB [Gammaproteobacteria bacterium]|nr:EF-P beta-lysylation protein EpmB [Gammaproteobacteria bacterium]
MSTLATDPLRTEISTDWRASLRDALRTPDELLEYLELSPEQRAALDACDHDFAQLVPRGFAARMRKRDAHDPLLRQVLPIARERETVAGFSTDPLAETEISRNGVLRKYAGRALLIATAACPIHCRYCFRRHFPYTDQTAARDEWQTAVATLADDREITEVILSGGDPLSLSNRRLGNLVDQLDGLEHLDTLRIHTRFPIVLPERIDTGLLELLATTRLETVLVVHCNHAQEIDESVVTALENLRGAGVIVLNQSVLLSGINDEAETLVELSRRLFAAGVLPYYLHELDRVAGAAHFAVETSRALELIESIRERLPGYLVPRLVRETPGTLSKTVLR